LSDSRAPSTSRAARSSSTLLIPNAVNMMVVMVMVMVMIMVVAVVAIEESKQ
jgi:hypothetical protein